MLAYRNGKSAGRVGCSDWQGPHRFSGSQYVVPLAFARVLHYESCTYAAWRAKFMRHAADTDDAALRHVPFSFYRDSILLLREVRAASDAGKVVDAASEARLVAFYRERKVELLDRAIAAGAAYTGGGSSCQPTVLRFALRPGESGAHNSINIGAPPPHAKKAAAEPVVWNHQPWVWNQQPWGAGAWGGRDAVASEAMDVVHLG